ncbi:restriction endonuclease subunit S [Enterobacter hormaechei]|uniref:restriction endonuclease subunit S n=1 Tax=Enterobacter hormaechei TaxID=158836 RepID=UPI001367FEB3|nr:restriction endonuclease subunit S [Enterobacter hormaechei]MZJ53761.1 restriction endonuclease subunit S [Enterobacter hormaechei]MZJ73877.1 restriction endonuclease subunit S [Enterobacter hormaechei]MZK03324.1 restriction endonuclease subunit S [Enterobacter hormaechei]MZK14570.1 restriction endonuclease subunit S [Enterobacter hormaechei]MZK22146.1 restriction endonuclease subunit S [Enterobacter hormaechei]
MAKYKAYPEYKESGIEWLGRVPKHWSAKSLKFICTFNDQVISESAGQDYEIEYVDIGSVNSSQGITKTETMLLSKAPSRARRLVKDGDVIISTVRTYLEAISPIINPPDNMVVSTGFAVIRPSIGLNHAFAAYCLRASGFIKEVVARSVGVSYPAINASDLVNIPVPNMPLTEQLRIASFLDHETAKIDNLIEKQQQLIELLKEKRQAVISHAVTKGLNPDVPMKDSGVEWLGEVPEHWTVSTIKHISTFIGTGGTPKNSESFTDDDGIDWFSPGDFNGSLALRHAKKKITTQAVSNGDAKSYPKDSIVVIGIGATLGKVAFVDHEFSCNQQINIITPSKTVDHKYLTYSLLNQVEQMKQSSNASTIGIMNQEKTKQIWIAFPPKDEQIKILSVLSQKEIEFDELLKKSEYQILLLQERRTALISAAVTGKIDVRDWVAPDTQGVEEPQEATA